MRPGKKWWLAAGAAILVGTAAAVSGQAAADQPAMGEQQSGSLAQAVAHPGRSDADRARDRYRHPAETLDFFGVDPDDTVVEIWPGSGWYTRVLAPYLKAGGGTLYLAAPAAGMAGVDKLKAADADLYGAVKVAAFPVSEPAQARVADGAADVVLTFRNVHNWRMGNRRDDKGDYSADAFRQMFAMLKPGGVLGVVDHRLPESAGDDREQSSGYIKVSTVRRLAEAAGFRFVEASEVNANPRDTADWPSGVWTLPPSLRLKDEGRERYMAIGESDRMTLKFVKPG